MAQCAPSTAGACGTRSYTPRDPASSALYGLVAEHRATFVQVSSAAGGAPAFVDEAFGRYLRCGILAHGFARFGCSSCKHEHLVPLSCKARGLCPSCGGKRMTALTQHIMERELPHVPVRQWVLSLPYPLRYRLAYDHDLCTAVHRALAGALRRRMRGLARERGERDAQVGSVTFVQRYGGALNLNVHYHLLALDGWFRREAAGLEFVHAPAPKQGEVEALVLDVQARVMRLLAREGMLDAGAEDPLGAEAPTLAACYEGAVTQRVGLGPGRGRPVMKIKTSLYEHLATAHERVGRGEGLLCAQVDGFDLHGRVAFGAHQRARLERLVRYCARPPLADDRLQKLSDGHYLLTLRTRWRDGTSHLKFEPIELMERLAAQIPKPRVNLVLYAGVLAPNAKYRKLVVDYARPAANSEETSTLPRAKRESWAELMRVAFELDVLACPRCGGRLRHIATILDAGVARKILQHLGRPSRAPPQTGAQSPPPFWVVREDDWS